MAAKNQLKDFGYDFNEEGKLRKFDAKTGKIITNEPFEFNISSSQSANQTNYEELGEIITDYVYDLLELFGLTRHYLPSEENIQESDRSFIFSTLKEFSTKVDKLLILIHGSGVVRAGQWSRSLIINDSLHTGTVLPYIKRAREEGYEVIVTNTNDNKRNGKTIKGSATPEKHAETVWKNMVQKIETQKIFIVAHSYGGVVTSFLAKTFEEDFNEKVCAVAFTDSVHIRGNTTKHLKEIAVNFVASKAPLNTVLSKNDDEIEERSAGTLKHELTSHTCIEHVFEFFKLKA